MKFICTNCSSIDDTFTVIKPETISYFCKSCHAFITSINKTKKLISAYKMTQLEMAPDRQKRYEAKTSKSKKIEECIARNSHKLLQEYKTIFAEYENRKELLIKEHRTKTDHYENQTCTCGAKLREILNKATNEYFLGCPNYFNRQVEHQSVLYEPKLYLTALNTKEYLLQILTRLNLYDHINQKSLYEFFNVNECEDLHFKYTGKPITSSFETWGKVNSISKAFEAISQNRLKEVWPNVFPQFPVKYQYEGDRPRECYIDILCSDDTRVCIYECKTSPADVNHDQMSLYIDCISFMNKGKKILSHHYLYDRYFCYDYDI